MGGNMTASAWSMDSGYGRTREVIYLRAFLNTLKPTISSPHPTTEALGPILNLKMTKPRETIKPTKHIMKGGEKKITLLYRS